MELCCEVNNHRASYWSVSVSIAEALEALLAARPSLRLSQRSDEPWPLVTETEKQHRLHASLTSLCVQGVDRATPEPTTSCALVLHRAFAAYHFEHLAKLRVERLLSAATLLSLLDVHAPHLHRLELRDVRLDEVSAFCCLVLWRCAHCSHALPEFDSEPPLAEELAHRRDSAAQAHRR